MKREIGLRPRGVGPGAGLAIITGLPVEVAGAAGSIGAVQESV
jgi:hypothetical protein